MQEVKDPRELPRGYFVRVAGTLDANGDNSKPGVYVNASMVEIVGPGEVITSGPDASAVFGASPAPQVAPGTPGYVPPGVHPGNMPAPQVPMGVPAMPGAPVGMPAMPGAPVGMPAPQVPMGVPAMPGAPVGMPAMPGAPVGMPAPQVPMGVPAMPAAPVGMPAAPVGMPAPQMPAAPQMPPPPNHAFVQQALQVPQMVPGCPYTYDQLKAHGYTDDQMRAAGYLQ